MKRISGILFGLIILLMLPGCQSGQKHTEIKNEDSIKKYIDTIGIHQILPPFQDPEKESGWRGYYLKGKVKSVLSINYNVEELDGKVVRKDETGHREQLNFDAKGMVSETKEYCDHNLVRPCSMMKHTFDNHGYNIQTDGIEYGNGSNFRYKFKNDEIGRPIETEYYDEYNKQPLSLKSIVYTSYNNNGQKTSESKYRFDKGTKIFSDSTEFIYHPTGRLLEQTAYGASQNITEKIRIQYNSDGHVQQRRIYGMGAKLQQIWLFDEMGYLIEEKMFDKAGKITSDKKNPVDKDDKRTDASDNKWGKVVAIEFDKQGNWISKTYGHNQDYYDKSMIGKPYLIIKRTIEYW